MGSQPKLSEEKVIRVFELKNTPMKSKDIAKEMSVSNSTISFALNGRGEAYQNIIQKYNLKIHKVEKIKEFKPKPKTKTKVDDERIPQIVEMWNSGMSQTEIGKRFGVSQSYISRILLRKRKAMLTENLQITDTKTWFWFKYRIPSEKAEEAIKMFKMGYYKKYIAQQLKISEEKLKQILNAADLEDAPTFSPGQYGDEVIIKIFQLHNDGHSQVEIEKIMGIDQTHISNILRKKLYKSVIEKYDLKPNDSRLAKNRLSDEEIQKAFQLYELGQSASEIAATLEKNYLQIANALRGINYKERLIELNLKPHKSLMKSLTDDELITIFKLKNEGKNGLQIAKIIGTHPTTIYFIFSGKYYAKRVKELNLKLN